MIQEVFVSSDKSRLDLEFIHSFLSKESYWARGRTRDQVKKSIEHSECFGIYVNGEQVGFARVVTDHATVAHLVDVFISSDHRGKGYSTVIMDHIFNETDLGLIKRWMLGTQDAHKLYERYGFRQPAHFERWMERVL